MEQRHKRGVGKLYSPPRPGRHRAKLQVGIGELPEDLPRRAGERPLHRQEFLLRLREHMGPSPDQPL